MHTVLIDVAVMIIFAAVFAYIARMLKQPIIPAYVFAGLILGPLGLNSITDTSLIFNISEIGIAFLLFIVGLEMSYSRFKKVGKTAVKTGVVDIFLMSSIGFLIATLFGFVKIEALYIGLALAFGSTMVVLKLLSDHEELKSLHGRLMIGILLTEDLVIIVVLMLLRNLDNFSIGLLFFSVLKVILFVAGALLAAKFILPHIFNKIAKYQDSLFLGSMGWLFLIILIANSIDFSIAIGAFIAGISLASTPYNLEIIGKLKHFKDFFVALFFVSLGMLIIPIPLSLVPVILVLLAVPLFVKPTFLYSLLHFKYHKKSAFLASTGLAQISEFSLILATTGLMYAHISNSVFSIIVILAIVTMSITPYVTNSNGEIYNKLASKYNIFRDGEELERLPKALKNHVVVCGSDRTGIEVIKFLKKSKQKFVVVDYNPDIVKELINKKINCVYGDVEDIEILDRIKIHDAKAIISTVPLLNENLFLLKVLELVNSKALFLGIAKDVEDAVELYAHGADYVIVPHTAGGEKLGRVFSEYLKHKKLVKDLRNKHIQNLRGTNNLLDREDPFKAYFENEH